jgi:hypothetical protein
MLPEGSRATIMRLGAIVFVIVALGLAGRSVWKFQQVPRGSESDRILLTCSACSAETELPDAEFRKLVLDEKTGLYPCPKCGAPAAEIATFRCPYCKRGIPPQAFGSPLACPFCKKPFGTSANTPAPGK